MGGLKEKVPHMPQMGRCAEPELTFAQVLVTVASILSYMATKHALERSFVAEENYSDHRIMLHWLLMWSANITGLDPDDGSLP